MNILLISGSLNPDSKSRILVKAAETALQNPGVETRFEDLRDHPLPFCDGGAAYDDPQVAVMNSMIRDADAILLGVPVYNFDVNAALKNLVELTGSAWENKVVGFLCAAGGRSSYMSVANFGNDLMLDFRCLIVPRFIYAVRGDFENGHIVNEDIRERVVKLANEARCIAASGYSKLARDD